MKDYEDEEEMVELPGGIDQLEAIIEDQNKARVKHDCSFMFSLFFQKLSRGFRNFYLFILFRCLMLLINALLFRIWQSWYIRITRKQVGNRS